MQKEDKPNLKQVTHPTKETEDKNIRSIETSKEEKQSEVSHLSIIEEEKESKQTLDDTVKKLNSYAQTINRNLQFNIDTDSGKTVVKVIDADTDELIRQIPNEEALQMTKKLDQNLVNESGLLLTNMQA